MTSITKQPDGTVVVAEVKASTETYGGGSVPATVATDAEVAAALANRLIWLTPGLLSARPTAAAAGVNAVYFATDVNGGTMYESNGSVWTQLTAGINAPSGTQLNSVSMTTSGFTITATAVTDVTGMSMAVPASARPVRLRFKGEVQIGTGTSASGSVLSAFGYIAANDGTALAADATQAVSSGTSYAHFGKFVLEAMLDAPVAAGTYKLQARLNSVITGAGAYNMSPGYGAFAARRNVFEAISL